jgi:hypothetical protein
VFTTIMKQERRSQKSPEGSPGSFPWSPLDPDRQHYTVSISCRDGVFVERWEVTRVNGVLRSTITIEHGPQWLFPCILRFALRAFPFAEGYGSNL